MRWYRKAADQGYAKAQFNLGFMFAHGTGVPLNEPVAAWWFTRAANQGLPIAQNEIGHMYFNGEGVPKDYVQAYMWFNLAAASGYSQAAKNRAKVEKFMTSQQIAEAQARAAAWKPTNGQ